MKIRWIIFIVPLVLLLVALVSGADLVLRLFFVSLLALLIGYLWTLFGLRGIRARMGDLPDRCQVGEEFEEKVTVLNNSRIPKLFLTMRENTDWPGHHSISALNLPPVGSFLWQRDVQCRRRGKYILGSLTATVTDPFGLFSRQRELGEPHSILVYPATLELPFFTLSSSATDFDYGSSHRSISRISPEASSVREFTTGDSLSHIHWRSTAHTGKLMVKTFDAEHSRNGSKSVWVLPDMDRAANVGEGGESTEEYGVTIAASLAMKYLDRGVPVGLAASGDQRFLFPADRGEVHFRRLLEALALMKATGEVTVDRVISEASDLFKGNSAVIIITASATEKLTSAVRHLQNRGNSAVVVLLDSASFGSTVSSLNLVRSLSIAGVPVYLVKKGDDLARALDGRATLAHARFV
jgi:uncharacterized protein (DUF58 family)